MDPNANLEEQLEIAKRLLDENPAPGHEPTEDSITFDAERLAELVIALDEWIRKGGFLPASWAHTKSRECDYGTHSTCPSDQYGCNCDCHIA